LLGEAAGRCNLEEGAATMRAALAGVKIALVSDISVGTELAIQRTVR
jgi:hypothetical protein